MEERVPLVIVRLDDQLYGIHLAAVERIIRAVEITPLPNAPEIVLGAIDMAGRVIPVLNLRLRFHLPERLVVPSDHFLIANTGRRVVVLVVDEAFDVVAVPRTAIVEKEEIVPGLAYIEGVLRIDQRLILIHDLARFLSLEEEHEIDEIGAQGEFT